MTRTKLPVYNQQIDGNKFVWIVESTEKLRQMNKHDALSLVANSKKHLTKNIKILPSSLARLRSVKQRQQKGRISAA